MRMCFMASENTARTCDIIQEGTKAGSCRDARLIPVTSHPMLDIVKVSTTVFPDCFPIDSAKEFPNRQVHSIAYRKPISNGKLISMVIMERANTMPPFDPGIHRPRIADHIKSQQQWFQNQIILLNPVNGCSWWQRHTEKMTCSFLNLVMISDILSPTPGRP
mmetsp:Transcript_42493/g.69034  ORF Transcript_42493/g.69034 Transcript_42493/m.69034 type:complete len:162 (-) Transcript_42493:134-619(-)